MSPTTTPSESRYMFRGHAVPIAGRIRRPRDLAIDAQAATTVPVTGGRCRAAAGPVTKLHGMISFNQATSSVDADYEDLPGAASFTTGNHASNKIPVRTVIETSVQGLEIVNAGPASSRVLKAALVDMQMTGRNGRNRQESEVTIDRAAIDGLELDGFKVRVNLRAKMFCDNNTKGKLTRAYEDDDPFFNDHGHMFLDPPARAAGKRKVPEAGGLILCTIVHSLEWDGPAHPNARLEGNRIVFPEFGQIYLGEVLISGHSRRLTMMRVHLGSPDGGEVGIGDGEPDGHDWPPS